MTKLISKRSMKQGFTLIEILIVISIIGILAAIGLGSFQSSQSKSRDARRKSDLRQISTALEVYYNDFGSYPLANANGRILGCGVNGVERCTWNDPFTAIVNGNEVVYMAQLPGDTLRGMKYFYTSDGRSYQIYARLENENDREVPDVDGEPQVYSGTDCKVDLCNFGISSTNSTLSPTEAD